MIRCNDRIGHKSKLSICSVRAMKGFRAYTPSKLAPRWNLIAFSFQQPLTYIQFSYDCDGNLTNVLYYERKPEITEKGSKNTFHKANGVC